MLAMSFAPTFAGKKEYSALIRTDLTTLGWSRAARSDFVREAGQQSPIALATSVQISTTGLTKPETRPAAHYICSVRVDLSKLHAKLKSFRNGRRQCTYFFITVLTRTTEADHMNGDETYRDRVSANKSLAASSAANRRSR